MQCVIPYAKDYSINFHIWLTWKEEQWNDNIQLFIELLGREANLPASRSCCRDAPTCYSIVIPDFLETEPEYNAKLWNSNFTLRTVSMCKTKTIFYQSSVPLLLCHQSWRCGDRFPSLLGARTKQSARQFRWWHWNWRFGWYNNHFSVKQSGKLCLIQTHINVSFFSVYKDYFKAWWVFGSILDVENHLYCYPWRKPITYRTLIPQLVWMFRCTKLASFKSSFCLNNLKYRIYSNWCIPWNRGRK